MASWDDLGAELSQWQALGQKPQVWWRDDDAGQWGAELDRLLALAQDSQVPLGLAVIPMQVKAETVEHINQAPMAYVLQHGVDHQNYAPVGEKKAELGAHRELQTICTSLQDGWVRLSNCDNRHKVLVPPWNRIDDTVSAGLAGLGYEGLSTFKARKMANIHGVKLVNTHVDIIDWKGTRGFVGQGQCLQMLVDHLRQKRLGHIDNREATGVLSHHLVHDEGCWQFLVQLFAYKGIEWINPFIEDIEFS